MKSLRKLQHQLNFDEEERNQYYYSFEQKEDLDDTEAIAQSVEKLKLNHLRKNFAHKAEDFLMEYNIELEMALQDCITQHQNLIKICEMLEQLYNPIVLVKSIQITLQLCNLAYVSTKVWDSFYKLNALMSIPMQFTKCEKIVIANCYQILLPGCIIAFAKHKSFDILVHDPWRSACLWICWKLDKGTGR